MTPTVTFFVSSNAVVISSVSSIRASDVDIILLNPYWLLLRRLYMSMKESNHNTGHV